MFTRLMPSCLAITLIALGLSGCFNVPSGSDLANGCYYSGETAVFRIAGDQGEVLVDGDVQHFEVSSDRDGPMARAIFSPGFDIVSGPPIRVSRDAQFPKAYYMMAPGDVPTIMMSTASDQSLVYLKFGESC